MVRGWYTVRVFWYCSGQRLVYCKGHLVLQWSEAGILQGYSGIAVVRGWYTSCKGLLVLQWSEAGIYCKGHLVLQWSEAGIL